MATRLFAPLGWSVEADPVPLDPHLPQWGDSRFLDLRLHGEVRLADALNHLYVLLPVLDDTKHYWVTTDEVDKLVRAGEGWLHTHPERELISHRYLAHHRDLTANALDRLAELDDAVPEDAASVGPARSVPLAAQRVAAVLAVLRDAGAARVLDLGCGEGALIAELLAEPRVTEVVGVDVSPRTLEVAARRLHLDRLSGRQRERVRLLQSSLTYRDDRLAGFDAAVLMEVVEHIDPPRIEAMERTVFAHARPGIIVVTTPNAEHNVRFPDLLSGAMRHRDHRFEWSRAQFHIWADGVAAAYGYGVRVLGVGPDDAEVGPPRQLAVFTRAGE